MISKTWLSIETGWGGYRAGYSCNGLLSTLVTELLPSTQDKSLLNSIDIVLRLLKRL